jgi:hypothetical protein
LVFEKNAIFWQKWSKIAENCDHNIDPNRRKKNILKNRDLFRNLRHGPETGFRDFSRRPLFRDFHGVRFSVIFTASAFPGSSPTGSLEVLPRSTEESARKREIRLLKNREAARECRNKKKEYIKCLENRVAVLENQNKALIEELKSLKELYTGQKS